MHRNSAHDRNTVRRNSALTQCTDAMRLLTERRRIIGGYHARDAIAAQRFDVRGGCGADCVCVCVRVCGRVHAVVHAFFTGCDVLEIGIIHAVLEGA